MCGSCSPKTTDYQSQVYLQTLVRGTCLSKMLARLLLESVEYLIVMGWLVMKKHKLTHVGLAGRLRRHNNRTMAKPLPRRAILIRRVLRIVNQHIRPLNKGQKHGIAAVLPLDIGRENQFSPTLLNAIDRRAI